MCNIVIVTETTYAPLNAQQAWFDDEGLAQALNRLGHSSSILAWTDKTQNWQQFDAIFVSTTWDACETPQAFLDWLEHTESDGVKRLINSRAVIEDGFVKYRYMTKLERLLSNRQTPPGFITPSRFLLDAEHPDEGLEPFKNCSLEDLLGSIQDDLWAGADIVLKPCISADGKDTFLCERGSRDPLRSQDSQHRQDANIIVAEEAEKTFQRLARNHERGGVIVQPYMRGVERGEYSLTFFEDRFSHAVRKPAGFKNSDSQRRVAVGAADLPPNLLEFATHTVNIMRNLYGSENITRVRVDLFDEAGVPVLCEFEMVEPNTNIGVVARDRGDDDADAIFRNYAAAISNRAQKLSAA